MLERNQKPGIQDLTEQEQSLFRQQAERRKKSPARAWILWLFLGGVGGHRFYLGRTGSAIFMLLTLGGSGVWWVIDAFLLPGMLREDRRKVEGQVREEILAARTEAQRAEAPRGAVSKAVSPPMPLLVSATRAYAAYVASWERGLLAVDARGITYLPVASSQAMKLLTTGEMLVTAAFLLSGLLTGQWLELAPLVVVMYMVPLPFASAMRKRALAQEETAKMRGLSAVQATGAEWHADWNELSAASVKQVRWGFIQGAALRLKPVSSTERKFQLAGRDEVLGFTHRAEETAALREAIARCAPGRFAP